GGKPSDAGRGGQSAAGGVDGSGAWDDLADTVENIRTRFGEKAVRPARLAEAEDVSNPDRLYGPGDSG
ncbi:MAG: hypothetical protein KJN81_07275, partial [Acidimicrobiia bacterium]|nr:hypothetical protein [Acidimicrobiia bacterium]